MVAAGEAVTGPPLRTRLEERLLEAKADAIKISLVGFAPLLNLESNADEEVEHELMNFKEEDNDTIILKFDPAIQDLAVEFAGELELDSISEDLDEKEAVYVLHRFSHVFEKQKTKSEILILFLPENIDVTSRVRMASVRLNLVQKILKCGIPMPRAITIPEIAALTVPNLLEELYPKRAAEKRVMKPRRKEKAGKSLARRAKKFSPE